MKYRGNTFLTTLGVVITIVVKEIIIENFNDIPCLRILS